MIFKKLYLLILFLIISAIFGFGSLVFFILINIDWKISLFFSYILTGCLSVMLFDYSYHYYLDYIGKIWRNKNEKY